MAAPQCGYVGGGSGLRCVGKPGNKGSIKQTSNGKIMSWFISFVLAKSSCEEREASENYK